MTIWMFLVAFCYLLCGAHLWTIIVMRPLTEDDRTTCRNQDDWVEMVERKRLLVSNEKSQCVDYFLSKSTFVLLWPIAIVYGFIHARLF